MVYTIVLLVLFSISWCAGYIKPGRRRTFMSTFFFLVLALLAGFRYQNEYSDFLTNYNRIIQAADQTWYQALHYSSSVLHQIIRKIVGMVFRDPQWYFLLSSVFIVGMNLKVFKEHAYSLFLCVFLYYVEFGYFSANNVTRQAIAVAICLGSWRFIVERKQFRYLIVIALAMLVHSSAIFFLPVYYISEIRLNSRNLRRYAVVTLAVVLFSPQLTRFLQRFLYSDYSESSYGMTPSNKLRLVIVALCLFIIFVEIYRNEKHGWASGQRDQYQARYYNFILSGTYIYAVCSILSCFRILLFSRIGLYYVPCAVLCIDRAVGRTGNPQIRRIVLGGLIAFFIAWFAVMNYLGKYIPTPYTPFWQFPDRALVS